jgi:hypothetical protein
MPGVNILNQEAVTENPDWSVWALIILAIVAVVCWIIVASRNENEIFDFIICLLGVGCGLAFFAVMLFDPQAPTDRYRYECTIDESVSIQDIYDNYEVIEQRGQIWILEDKEVK